MPTFLQLIWTVCVVKVSVLFTIDMVVMGST